MDGKVLPSPSTNLFEQSMGALASTFNHDPQPDPAMNYIVGNFLDSMDTLQNPMTATNQQLEYHDEMLILDSHYNPGYYYSQENEYEDSYTVPFEHPQVRQQKPVSDDRDKPFECTQCSQKFGRSHGNFSSDRFETALLHAFEDKTICLWALRTGVFS